MQLYEQNQPEVQEDSILAAARSIITKSSTCIECSLFITMETSVHSNHRGPAH